MIVAHLNTSPNIANVDDVYQRLVDLHTVGSIEESLRLNAKLILILVNHIGDSQVINEAITLTRQQVKCPTR